MINIKENEKLNMLNHSCAHLLAHAIKHLYPKALFWVGPAIEEGFYYDIDLDESITIDDLNKIEKEMKKISKSDKRITRLELSKKEALDMFKDNPYKLDIINNLSDDEVITAYKQDVYTVVSTLPAQGVEGIGYLVPIQGENLKYNVYVWEIVDDTTTPPTYGFGQAGSGNVSIDLSNYYTKSEIDGLLSAKLSATDLVPLTNAEIDAIMV